MLAVYMEIWNLQAIEQKRLYVSMEVGAHV